MALQFERVGLLLRPEMISVIDKDGDAGKFTALVKKVMAGSDALILLRSDKVDVLKAGAEVAKERRPILASATPENADAMGALAKEMDLPLVAKAEGLRCPGGAHHQAHRHGRQGPHPQFRPQVL